MWKFVRRWYWWLPALLVAAGLGYVGHRAMHPPWTDTEAWAVYQNIRLGMTFREVDEAAGHPRRLGRAGAWPNVFVRMGNGDEVGVALDQQGRVCAKRAKIQGHDFHDPPLEENWLDRWRARLGW